MKHAWLLVALVFLLGLATRAWAVQTDNRGIHAPPASGQVTIDGKLDDWDLSGQVLVCYDVESLRDVYSGQVAMMHDRAHLYVAIHWKDPMPMGNSHDPRFQANKGWAGDCVQLRIKTDRISHVTAWYYGPTQEPAMHIDYGKSLTEPFGGGDRLLRRTEGWKLEGGAEMAFVANADGRGYVQEIKFPWELITNKRQYQAGDQFSCGVELLFGEADWPVHRYADNLAASAASREFFWTAHQAWGPVYLEVKGQLTLPTPAYLKGLEAPLEGPVKIEYDLPKDARLTLVIEDASGRRVRNLVAAASRKRGRNVEYWDGLDDRGQAVEPGEYRFKGIYHDGIHVNWTMSFASPGNPSWQTPDERGALYGDHSAPQAAAAGGEYVALACPMGEAGQHLIGCDLKGQRLWGLANRTAFDGGHIALATDGKILYVANEGKNSVIYRVELATGKYSPWDQKGRDAAGKEIQVLDLPVSAQPGVAANWKMGVNLSAIALGPDALAVSLKRENKVKFLDKITGRVLKEMDIQQPQAVVYDAKGSLMVLSEGRLLRVDAHGEAKLMAEPVYPDGYALATDKEGNIYLSVRGKDQNVKVISSEGKLLREIGKRGGRPAVGVFDERGMRNPAGMAIDSQGRLWVAEETMNPKRTSVWGLDGRFLRDLVGTTTYAGAGAINPYDPAMAFSDNTVYQIDLATGAWGPRFSIGKVDHPDDIFPMRVESRIRVVQRGDVTLVYTSDRTGGVRCTMGRNGVWRAAAFLGMVRKEVDPEHNVNYAHPLLKPHAGKLVAWSDANGDGLAQETELAFGTPEAVGRKLSLRHYYWGTLPDVEGTIAYVWGEGNALVKFPIVGQSECGAPVYDPAKPQVLVADQPVLGLGNGEGHILGGSNGRFYLNQDPLIGIDKEGRVLGGYPNQHTSVHGSHTAKAARPGYLIGPSSILGTADLGGEIGEVFDLNGNLGENYLFTHDGLWIQALFKDTRGWFETPNQAIRGMPMDATTAGGESFGGNFVRTPDGKVYLTIGGTDARVMEVTGLPSIRRFAGHFTYRREDYAKAQEIVQQNAARKGGGGTYRIGKAQEAITVDGKPQEWSELMDENKPVIDLREEWRRYARVQLRYDQDNLYLGYRVYAPGAMRNGGQNEKLLFKTGDAVDLMLGVDRQEKSADARPGDLRLLMTIHDRKPLAMLNQKVTPGAKAEEKYGFTSPWRTITFDRVVPLDEAKMATAVIPEGYFFEAAIPWRSLGVEPKAGLKLHGDVGVLFADNSGNNTVARHYWSNKNTGLVNDVPGEADLTPGLWGTLVLE